MEFYSKEAQAEDWDLLRTLGTAGRQIGLFVERTEVEAALQENEARTSLIIDTALDAVITIDRVGQITEWNTQAEQVFGWSALEAIGRDVADTIFPPSHRPGYREYVQRLLESRDPSLSNMLVEMIGLRRDGREFPVEIAMTPLAVEGSVIFSAFIRDITSRKEAERALKDYAQQLEDINQQLDTALKEAKAATEAKSSFLATMSHEIRTPMNGVIGMAGLLLDTKLTDEQREYAETVQTCGDHLLTIINDILDFSKIEAGKLDLEVIEFDLRLAMDESLDLVAERASSKGLNLACLFHADVPRNLLGDSGTC
jgi:PAS domain S-box-containing protein